MPTIGSKKFNWVRTLSARENINAWREKRKAIRQDFESQTAAATSRLNSVWYSQAKGAADLGIEIAIARVKRETAAMQAEREAAAAKGENNIPSSRESIFSFDSKMTLGSGTTIDIQSGTMTMKDGTQIDLKTGIKKVNIVT
jgi:hypothetical protein